MKTFVILLALVLAAGLTLAGCGTAKAPTAKSAVTVTQTVTAKPAPAKTHSAKPKPVNASATASAPTQAAALPGLATDWAIDPPQFAVKPSTINTSADGTGALSGITWTSWTASGAEGSGSIRLDNGVPNMAQGTVANVPVSIGLSDPVKGDFTVMTATDHAGNKNTYSFPGDSNTDGLSVDVPAAPPATQADGLPSTGVWYPAGYPNVACGPPLAGNGPLNTSYVDESGNGVYSVDGDDPTFSPCNS
jgi:hypothetical protein